MKDESECSTLKDKVSMRSDVDRGVGVTRRCYQGDRVASSRKTMIDEHGGGAKGESRVRSARSRTRGSLVVDVGSQR